MSYRIGKRPRMDRITVANIVDGKLVKTFAWQHHHWEDPEHKAERLLRMKLRLAGAQIADIKGRIG